MYFLAAFNYDNADYYSYTLSYNQAISIGADYRYLGYSSWVHLFGSRGITYSQYLLFSYAFTFTVLFVAIRILTDKPNPVLAYYLIFSFGVDVVQLKALYSEVIALLGISIILKRVIADKKEKVDYKILIGFILCFVSMLFHFSGAFYIVACGIYYIMKNRENISKRIFIFLGLSLILIYSGLLPNILNFANRLGIISNFDYLIQYGQRSTRWGFLITYVGVFLLVGACWQKSDSFINKDKTRLDQDVLRQFIITALLLLPLLLINWAYDRLIRIYMVLMYIYFVNKPKTNIVTGRQALSYITFISAIAYFYYIDISSTFDRTLGAILRYNSLFR